MHKKTPREENAKYIFSKEANENFITITILHVYTTVY